MEIKTDRLILRQPTQRDLCDVNSFMAHPEAMRFWSTPPHRDIEHTRRWLQANIDVGTEVRANFLIEFEGRVICEVGAFPLPDFGFILHPDYWRRGFGFEAASAAIKHIFESRSENSLVADVDPRNESSIALLEKLGFRKTGQARATLCVAGEWVDSSYYCLTRPQIQGGE